MTTVIHKHIKKLSTTLTSEDTTISSTTIELISYIGLPARPCVSILLQVAEHVVLYFFKALKKMCQYGMMFDIYKECGVESIMNTCA